MLHVIEKPVYHNGINTNNGMTIDEVFAQIRPGNNPQRWYDIAKAKIENHRKQYHNFRLFYTREDWNAKNDALMARLAAVKP